jgi:hypothetical protein
MDGEVIVEAVWAANSPASPRGMACVEASLCSPKGHRIKKERAPVVAGALLFSDVVGDGASRGATKGRL